METFTLNVDLTHYGTYSMFRCLNHEQHNFQIHDREEPRWRRSLEYLILKYNRYFRYGILLV